MNSSFLPISCHTARANGFILDAISGDWFNINRICKSSEGIADLALNSNFQ